LKFFLDFLNLISVFLKSYMIRKMDISLTRQQNTNRLEENYSEFNIAFDKARPRVWSILSLS
jgi:hypothetical protein